MHHVAEVLCDGQRRERDAGTGPRRFVHLTEDHGGLVENASVGHFLIKGGAFTGTLSDTGEDGVAAVPHGDVVNELLNQNGLADAGAAKEADLAAATIRSEQVDDLDTGHEDFGLGILIDEAGSVAVDGIALRALDFALAVNALAEKVHDAAERAGADRHHHRGAKVQDLLAAHEADGGAHGDGTDTAVTEVLSDLKDQIVRFVAKKGVGGLQRGLQTGADAAPEFDIDHGTEHLNDMPDVFLGGGFGVVVCHNRIP